MATVHMTPEGAQKLQDELDTLWKVERPRVTQAVAEAAAMGDRSENAEYIYGKKRLREIDSRVRWLKKRLEDAIIVEQKPKDRDRDRVFFGAYVKLKDNTGKITDFRLVGPADLDVEKRMITLASPIGLALKGRSKGETVTVRLPRGEVEYCITDVSYDPFDETDC